MALTKDFRETIRERAQQEPQFRKALLREAIELLLSGDEKTAKMMENAGISYMQGYFFGAPELTKSSGAAKAGS